MVKIERTTPFKFYLTVNDQYHFPHFDRHMINFSNSKWRNRQKPIEKQGTELFIDSGGFHEITNHGEYRYSIDYYLDVLDRALKPDVFATMDWMCEPFALEQSGLTVDDHIEKTVENASEIIGKYDGDAKVMPVVQGWEVEDYLHCIDRFKEQGCITGHMGIGSICREVTDGRIIDIILAVREELPNVKLHGFGINKSVLKDWRAADALDSSDSFAWSYANQKGPDLRGKDRIEYAAAYARDIELTAYKSLINRRNTNRISTKTPQKNLEQVIG